MPIPNTTHTHTHTYIPGRHTHWEERAHTQYTAELWFWKSYDVNRHTVESVSVRGCWGDDRHERTLSFNYACSCNTFSNHANAQKHTRAECKTSKSIYRFPVDKTYTQLCRERHLHLNRPNFLFSPAPLSLWTQTWLWSFVWIWIVVYEIQRAIRSQSLSLGRGNSCLARSPQTRPFRVLSHGRELSWVCISLHKNSPNSLS